MTFIKNPPGDTIIKRPDFGTSVRMKKLSTPAAKGTTTTTPALPREIRVYVDGVDSGLLPQDVTEIQLNKEEPCLVRLDHDGVTPVVEGDFEFATLGNCAATDVIYNEVDVIGSLPSCSSAMDVKVECVLGVPTLIVRDAGLVVIATQSLADVLPPITLTINGVEVGTVSRCATEITIDTPGTCEWNGETCVGSGTVDVDDGQGGVYSAGFGC